MHKYLKDRAESNFRPEATPSRIFLVHCKKLPRFALAEELSCGKDGRFEYLAGSMMYYVRQHELRYGETMGDLIHELDRIGSATYPPVKKTTWVGRPITQGFALASTSTDSWSPTYGKSSSKMYTLASQSKLPWSTLAGRILETSSTSASPWPLHPMEGAGRQMATRDRFSSHWHRERDLVAYAVELDLQIFVRETLQHNRLRNDAAGGTPLLYHALSTLVPSTLGLPDDSTPHAMMALLLDLKADINTRSSAWPGATLWSLFLYSVSASVIPQISTYDADLFPVDERLSSMIEEHYKVLRNRIPIHVIGDVHANVRSYVNPQTGTKHDPAIRWHFSTLNDVCRSLCRDIPDRITGSRMALPADDVSLLEMMLHHGADPDEMDARVLIVLLKQCCGDCQIRFKASSERISQCHHKTEAKELADPLAAAPDEDIFDFSNLQLSDEGFFNFPDLQTSDEDLFDFSK